MPVALSVHDRGTLIRAWFMAWDFGRKYGPVMVTLPAMGFAIVSWKGKIAASILTPQKLTFVACCPGEEVLPSRLNAAAALLMGSIVLYTKFDVFPINDKLLAENDRLRRIEKKENDSRIAVSSLEEVQGVVKEWQKADAMRMITVHLAVLMGAVALILM